MLTLVRTDSNHQDFQMLVKLLDAELRIRDGDEHDFYAQFNGLDQIRHVVVAYLEDVAVGCGAFKHFDIATVEIKRMFVRTEYRGRRIAEQVLSELETWAVELGFKSCLLETGFQQPEAIRLYVRNGFYRIPNYGQYQGVDGSLCLQKMLREITNSPSSPLENPPT